MIGNKLAMNAGDDFLLAGMRTGGKPERARPNLLSQLLELREIHRQSHGRGFNVAGCRKPIARGRLT